MATDWSDWGGKVHVFAKGSRISRHSSSRRLSKTIVFSRLMRREQINITHVRKLPLRLRSS